MTEHDDRDTYSTYDTYGTDVYGYDEPMVGPLDAPDRPSGFHPVNVGQLVMGVAFAGLLVVWALFQTDVVDGSQLRWMMPVPWIAAGAAGLAATVWPSRSRSAE
ncbi:hypothetical protein [Nocardioides okcheonensis]|uniref:hypothetical protein n=1 Tax=Nocardioides okcheonensis TaxID=2894081 RepID=UPI001E4786A7|nr:hypothetical protein [Nocardioides okcheonensis]UFN43925.1 hypothetical protein LN652_18030 [Nocardioides okcheonensis]